LIKLISDLARGRLFGHPVHMMLVHFPSALFPVSLIADIAGIVFKEHNFFIFGFYSAVTGTTFGWLALLFGIVDLLKIPGEQPAFNKALIHGGLNFLWLTIFTIIIGMEIKNHPQIGYSLLKVIGKSIAVAGLLFSNFIGGELVLKYGIGKKEDILL
jgi:uncharacterized membrane protein